MNTFSGKTAIAHFRVAWSPSSDVRPGAQPFSFSFKRMGTKTHFDKEAKGNSEMGYWITGKQTSKFQPGLETGRNPPYKSSSPPLKCITQSPVTVYLWYLKDRIALLSSSSSWSFLLFISAIWELGCNLCQVSQNKRNSFKCSVLFQLRTHGLDFIFIYWPVVRPIFTGEFWCNFVVISAAIFVVLSLQLALRVYET